MRLVNFYACRDHPEVLRRIEFYDEEKKKVLVFLTNNFKLAVSTIAGIYKARWQIELFFKWIKQNLKIKSFLGTSKNAVMTQTQFAHSLLYLSRVIRETLMDRNALIDILTLNPERLGQIKIEPIQYQLGFPGQ